MVAGCWRSLLRPHVKLLPRTMSSHTDIPTKIPRLSERLVWVDLEMTGLDVEKEEIMEAAVIITDSELNVVSEGPNIILKVEDKVLDNMNDWCRQHHGKSGLTEGCRKSIISLSAAEDQLLQFVTQHTEKGKAPLAGNSVHADKKFLDKYMPKLMKHLHYRIVDVSTVKELCRRWYPEDFTAAPSKKVSHRALDDIKESIEELKYYKSSIFK
ncbi:oligoribonuclease, mitochondrial-like [Homarus americanus]|uniref:Probable oligoribonuclease n=1 Tax=Homarus americanus TaxID=6706 RepID=A0A8J5JXL7_HOMAM|nr:oligoribonuclease, mitochondrial-like [Homarus americanus]KAG7163240.1 Oligoribonuclease-like [Homarus americanus]